MKITKTLGNRINGNVKQNKNIPYKFHLIGSAGFKSTKEQATKNLMNDLSKWADRYGVKIDIIQPYNHVFGFTFIVRDHRAVELLAYACEGKIIVDGEIVPLYMLG